MMPKLHLSAFYSVAEFSLSGKPDSNMQSFMVRMNYYCSQSLQKSEFPECGLKENGVSECVFVYVCYAAGGFSLRHFPLSAFALVAAGLRTAINHRIK